MRLAAQAKMGYYPTPENVMDAFGGALQSPSLPGFRGTRDKREIIGNFLKLPAIN